VHSSDELKRAEPGDFEVQLQINVIHYIVEQSSLMAQQDQCGMQTHSLQGAAELPWI